MTSLLGVVSVMGPNARQLLSRVTSTDLSNEAFPFGTAQEIVINGCRVRAVRISYVGELGWELHGPFGAIPKVYEALREAGADLSVTHAGHYAINAMRLEKAYRAWGHELSTDETPLEAGLGFSIDWQSDFLGKAALLEQRSEGIRKRLVAFVLEDPEPTLWGSEPIHMNGELAGYTTSGGFSPALGRAIGLGYVKSPGGEKLTSKGIHAASFSILNDGRNYEARPHLRSPYDPARKKME